ncbi:MAG: hypothetical protein GY796_33450 [Chloroflexi bacterium]|nr:hypothetical protein [Chloroflexota bacterium]
MIAMTAVSPQSLDNIPIVPCLPLDSARELLAGKDESRFRRLLLPFDCQVLDEPELADLMLKIRQVDGTVTILHVGCEVELDEERLFTTMRGLQAKISSQMSGVVMVDSIVADTAAALFDYARQHNIDLIVLPKVSA